MIEKRCPFCNSKMDQDNIKNHIGNEHLGVRSLEIPKPVENENQLEATIKVEISECHEENEHFEKQFDRQIIAVKEEKVEVKLEVPEQSEGKENALNTAFSHDDHDRKIIDKTSLGKHRSTSSKSVDVNQAAAVVADHHRVRYQCEKCTKSYSCRRRFREHVKSVHNGIKPKIFKCDKCEKTFTRNHILKEHVKIIHKDMNLPCESCEKTFDFQLILQKHVFEEHDGSRYKCKECEKSYSHKHRLTSHVNLVHKTSIENQENEQHVAFKYEC